MAKKKKHKFKRLSGESAQKKISKSEKKLLDFLKGLPYNVIATTRELMEKGDMPIAIMKYTYKEIFAPYRSYKRENPKHYVWGNADTIIAYNEWKESGE